MDNRGLSRILVIVLLPFILLVAAYLTYNFFIIPEPSINGLEEFSDLPAKKTVPIQGDNVTAIRISIIQGAVQAVVLEDSPKLSEASYNIEVIPGKLGLKDGKAVVLVEARSGFMKKTRKEIAAFIDTRPPSLTILRAPSLTAEGGAGLAIVRAGEADSVYIRLGEMTFRAFKEEKAGPAAGDQTLPDGRVVRHKNPVSTYYAFFPVPYGA